MQRDVTIESRWPSGKERWLVQAPDASFFFGVRIMLGTILGRFSIIYFRGIRIED